MRIVIALGCPLAIHDHPTDGKLILAILEPVKAVSAPDSEVIVTEPLANVRPKLGSAPLRLMEIKISVCSSASYGWS